ncbi:MAG: type 4a pilus biogenesis protein PilO [Gaiellaceae bacterium]
MNSLPAFKATPVAIRLAVVLAGLVVLAGGGYFLLIGPQKSQASSLTRQIADLNTKIRAGQSQAHQAAGLSKILVADNYKLQTAMPDTTDVAGLYLQLGAIAKDTGVSFDSISPGTVVDATTYQVIPLTLIFQGNFFDLSDFLHRLQSLVLVENGKLQARGRLFTIDQITFIEGDAGFPQIKATIDAEAYAYGHPVALGAAAAASTTTSTNSTTDTTGGAGS